MIIWKDMYVVLTNSVFLTEAVEALFITWGL